MASALPDLAAAAPQREARSWKSNAVRETVWLAAFVPLSVAFTWPIARNLTTALAGERDAWQTVWSIVWVRRSLLHGHSPFFTHDLWYPDGASLLFQALDLPDAVWPAALLQWINPITAYNLAVLWTFVASGAAMYVLGRGMGCSRPAAFLSGCAYTFCTYHFTHAQAHLTLISIQWLPLYVLSLWRMLERRHWGWSIAAGLFLSLATLASWYQLLDALFISIGVLFVWVVHQRGHGLLAFLPRALLLLVVLLILIGPLAHAMSVERAAQPYEGAHPADFYSADVESFYRPNAAQYISKWDSHYQRWTGNAGENAGYLGAVLLFLVLAGAALRGSGIWGYLLGGALGVLFSLGPALHRGGHTLPGSPLPYAHLVQSLPLLEFAGMPVRLAFVANFGLAAALAPALDALRRHLPWWLLAPLATLGVLEHAPRPFTTSTLPVPAPMRNWAQDPAPFTVIDLCHDNERQEWHQAIHGHPVFGVWLNRTPTRLIEKLEADPVVGALREPKTRTASAPFHSDALDSSFEEPVAPGAEPTDFSIDATGTLQVAAGGRTSFRVLSDDAAWLGVDGATVVDDSGHHSAREASGSIELTPGPHQLTLRYQQFDGEAVLRAWWTPPHESERILGEPDVPGGFNGRVSFRQTDLLLSREAALQHLHDLKVRYVVQPTTDKADLTEGQLGLHPSYVGEGVRIYEVPGAR